MTELTPEFLRMLAKAEDELTPTAVGWEASMDAAYRATAFRDLAQAIEARSAETTDSARKGESAVAESDVPLPNPEDIPNHF